MDDDLLEVLKKMADPEIAEGELADQTWLLSRLEELGYIESVPIDYTEYGAGWGQSYFITLKGLQLLGKPPPEPKKTPDKRTCRARIGSGRAVQWHRSKAP